MTNVSTFRRGRTVGRDAGRQVVLAGNYEVECGFCHELVELPAEALGRSVPCPACGGMLALVSPVPVVAAEPALPAFEPLDRDRWSPPGVPAERRAKLLAPSWRSVYGGLTVARGAALAAVPLIALFAVFDLFAFPLVRAHPLPLGRIELLVLTAALLVPLAWHAVGMAQCAVPPTPGASFVRRALRLQAAAVLVAAGLSVTDAAPLAFAVMLVAGFGLWLLFLNRLVWRLDEDDHIVVTGVRTRSRRYVVLLAVSLGLHGSALMAIDAKNWHVLWLCRATTFVLAGVFLFDYATLLRVAARAVARRAPAGAGA